MTPKKPWVKPSTGPDEWDVMAMLKAIQSVHEGNVSIELRSAGIGFSPFLEVTCRAQFDVLDGSRLPREVEVSNPFPCVEHQTLWAHCYDGLYRLDAAIQQAYEQAELPVG